MRCRNSAALVFIGSCVLSAQTPVVPEWQTRIMSGFTAQQSGDSAEAERQFDGAQAALDAAGPRSEGFASGVQQIASYLSSNGFELKAHKLYRTAIDGALRAGLPALHAQLQTEFGTALLNESLEMQARSVLRDALAATEKVYGPQAPELGAVLTQAAWASERAGILSEAETLLKREAKLKSVEPSASGQMIARFSGNPGYITVAPGGTRSFALPQFYERHNRNADAEAFYRDAIATAKSSQDRMASLQSYCYFLRMRKRMPEAEALQRQIIALRESSDAPGDREAARWDRQNLAQLYLESDNFDAALKLIDEQIATTPSGNAWDYYNGLQLRTTALIRQKNFEEAANSAKELLQSAQKEGQPAQVYNAWMRLAEVAEAQGNADQAKDLRARATASFSAEGNNGTAVQPANLIAEAQTAIQKGQVDAAMTIAIRVLSQVPSGLDRQSGCSNLAQVVGVGYQLFNAKKVESADALVKEAASHLESNCPPLGNNFYPNETLIQYFTMRGLTAEARRIIDRWAEVLETFRGADSPSMEHVIQQRIGVAQAEQNHRDALAMGEDLLRRMEATHGTDSQPAFEQLKNLARQYSSLEDVTHARELWTAVIGRSEHANAGSIQHAWVLWEVSQFYVQHRLFEDALAYATQAVEAARAWGEDAKVIEQFASNVATVEQARKSYQESLVPAVDQAGQKWFQRSDFLVATPSPRK